MTQSIDAASKVDLEIVSGRGEGRWMEGERVERQGKERKRYNHEWLTGRSEGACREAR